MPADRGSPGGNRGRTVALVAVIVLAGVLYLVGQGIIRHNAMQNCIDSGRRDCDRQLANP